MTAAEYVQQQAEEISDSLRKITGQSEKEKVSAPGSAMTTTAQLASLKGPNGSLLTPDQLSLIDARLQDEYLSQYTTGTQADGHPYDGEGTGPGIQERGETLLANQNLGKTTGSHYQYQALDSSGSRAGVLGQINQAVSSGKPVPIDVSTGVPGSEGHQMMIIGQHGDKLQIYNPWGHTTWVSSSQFVNGQLGSLTNYGAGGQTDSGLPIANAVEIPR